ncbi:hypothetical protein LUZ60_017729 [Juncus effusus]|nr:hypothetical protein LUZ60_017729 [Juncus effusus]
MRQYLEQLWNDWEIRMAVVCSLGLQIFLLFAASSRKRNVSIVISISLWLAYQLADSLAIFSLGYLSRNNGQYGRLTVFWAPFLLLHLGGQDTITALSIEDNELWLRHLLTFVSQVSLAIYVFSKSWTATKLFPAAVAMFLAGIVKYAERILALKRASMSSLRSSMLTDPDPGPNYAKFMEEYSSRKAAGLSAEIEVVEERRREVTTSYSQSENNNSPYMGAVCKAHELFQTFKLLFVNLILTFEHRKESQDFFIKLTAEKAYKVIEIELCLVYDILHSKAAVIHTWYGWLLRGTTLTCIITVFVLFTMSNKSGYDRIDVIVTYVLIGFAVGLEMYAIISMFFSFWTFVVLKKLDVYSNGLLNLHFRIASMLWPEKRPRWSDSIAQYNLITYALDDKPNCMRKTMKIIGIKEKWDNYQYTSYDLATVELKNLVFRELKEKMKKIDAASSSYTEFSDHRGQYALELKGYIEELGWSVKAEFDESIIIWHIATDLLFHSNQPNSNSSDHQISQHISDYMLFLLIVRPFMLPAGIGQIRFGDTCAEAQKFFKQRRNLHDKSEATKMILNVSTKYDPRKIKGDRSKSLLFVGCKLAHELQELFPETPESPTNLNEMWNLISIVWVEMLCYAASKCPGNFHAKQLSTGGELLTHVWFLMAHLGMGEQYRIEDGHARAKLHVRK